MLFILGCALFLWPLRSKIALCGDRFLLWLAGFFLWPLPICFWMLRAVSGSSSSQCHLFPCEESDLQTARLSFEDKKKKMLKRTEKGNKIHDRSSINQQEVINYWSEVHSLIWRVRRRRPDICIQGAFWVVCSEKSHLMPYVVTIIRLTVTFFFLIVISSKTQRQFWKDKQYIQGHRSVKGRGKKNDLATFWLPVLGLFQGQWNTDSKISVNLII